MRSSEASKSLSQSQPFPELQPLGLELMRSSATNLRRNPRIECRISNVKSPTLSSSFSSRAIPSPTFLPFSASPSSLTAHLPRRLVRESWALTRECRVGYNQHPILTHTHQPKATDNPTDDSSLQVDSLVSSYMVGSPCGHRDARLVHNAAGLEKPPLREHRGGLLSPPGAHRSLWEIKAMGDWRELATLLGAGLTARRSFLLFGDLQILTVRSTKRCSMVDDDPIGYKLSGRTGLSVADPGLPHCRWLPMVRFYFIRPAILS